MSSLEGKIMLFFSQGVGKRKVRMGMREEEIIGTLEAKSEG